MDQLSRADPHDEAVFGASTSAAELIAREHIADLERSTFHRAAHAPT